MKINRTLNNIATGIITISALAATNTFAEKFLYDAGVALVPVTSFGKSCTNFVRFSFANSYENIEKALEKIKKIL